MTKSNFRSLRLLACQDSPAEAEHCRRQLQQPHAVCAELGRSAVAVCEAGGYRVARHRVDIGASVAAAVGARRSIRPDDPLPEPAPRRWRQTDVQVVNTTTLSAARRLVDEGFRVLALNFANGVQPGGGFLQGARAQEEVLCRSSALYATLQRDPMYAAHRRRPLPDSTDWAILSPDVPVFRNDAGDPLPEPWRLGFLTCAAPYAPGTGQPRSGDLLALRIRRILDIARAYGYDALVLGAWGCGAFANDPVRTAGDFRTALEGHAGAFARVVFAIADWSSERHFIRPFCDVFSNC
jgi:uncharacterized protein (TIGR02452 family)